MTSPLPPTAAPHVDDVALARVLRGESRTPHDVLGAHPGTHDGVAGVVIRMRRPQTVAASVLVANARIAMQVRPDGLLTAFVPHAELPLSYRVELTAANGDVRVVDDPYRFLPTLGEVDLHLFGEGRHLRLWERLGAHPQRIDGVEGVAFAVWAPNAVQVSVVGSFNAWDPRVHPMRALGMSGVFELFVPDVAIGSLYKFEIRTRSGGTRVKTDPFAAMMEGPPGHASIVMPPSTHAWTDAAWIATRAATDPTRAPMLIYEVHLASWMRGDGDRLLGYRELAPLLAAHVKRLGFTHVELMPIQEHPFGGSWGYQVGGYYAPTSRHGSPDDFRFFVDTLHDAGIGVILDWVPAHFPKDDWALRRFDGTALYEHEDPRISEHPEWGTLIFNYARHETRNFLLANALYWIEEFHVDGLRVDAVASMLYLDYGRENGQWLRNRFGGRENLEAVSFLKFLNHTIRSKHPGVMTIAEESTTWPRVTHPIVDGGLGFTFKWNMGWMHDTLDFFRIDPLFRRGVHDKLTFAMMYEYSERFVNPLSHDEVVHLKKSLVGKMPGDAWSRFANVRALLAYSVTRPGKSLLFMGTELAPWGEWNHDESLPWDLKDDPPRQGIDAFMVELGALYAAHPAFWRLDHDPRGFSWVDVADKEQSVVSFARFDGMPHAIVVLNLTPVPRPDYRIGAPLAGTYHLALNSDDVRFGGSGYVTPSDVVAEAMPYHGFEHSMALMLPPLSALVLIPDPAIVAAAEASADAIAPLTVEVLDEVRTGATPDVTASVAVGAADDVAIDTAAAEHRTSRPAVAPAMSDDAVNEAAPHPSDRSLTERDVDAVTRSDEAAALPTGQSPGKHNGAKKPKKEKEKKKGGEAKKKKKDKRDDLPPPESPKLNDMPETPANPEVLKIAKRRRTKRPPSPPDESK